MKNIGFYILLNCIVPILTFAQATDSIYFNVDLNDIVVTGVPIPTDSKQALFAINRIDQSAIEKMGANNVEEVLLRALNIRIYQDNILGGSLEMQGVDGRNIKVMIDGVPVIRRFDNVELQQISTQNIDRIEIIEGPMSSMYGSNALGGVINIITKKSSKDDLVVQWTNQIESQGLWTSHLNADYRINNKLSVQLNGGRYAFNGFSSDTTRTDDWFPKKQLFGTAGVRYQLNADQSIMVKFSLFKEQIEVFGNIRRPNFFPYAFDDLYYTYKRDFSLLQEGSLGANFRLKTTSGYNYFNRTKAAYRNDFTTDTLMIIPSELDTTTFREITLRSVLSSTFKASKVNFQSGIDFNSSQGKGKRFAAEESANSIHDFALFGSINYQPIPRLDVQIAGRWAYNNLFSSPFIPSLHLKYKITDLVTWRASYGRGFRAPSIRELYYEFVDNNHFLVGNPDLNPESSHNFQSSIDLRTNVKEVHQLNSKTQLSYNKIQDQIAFVDFIIVDGEQVVAAAYDTTSTAFAYFNQFDYKNFSLKQSISYQWKGLYIKAGVNLNARINPEETLSFDGVPKFNWGLDLQQELTYSHSPLNWSFTFLSRNLSRLTSYYLTYDDQDQAQLARRILDGYSMLDFTTQKGFLEDRIQLSLGVKNLLNVTDIASQGGGGGFHTTNQTTAPVSWGRSYFVKLNLSFNYSRKK